MAVYSIEITIPDPIELDVEVLAKTITGSVAVNYSDGSPAPLGSIDAPGSVNIPTHSVLREQDSTVLASGLEYNDNYKVPSARLHTEHGVFVANAKPDSDVFIPNNHHTDSDGSTVELAFNQDMVCTPATSPSGIAHPCFIPSQRIQYDSVQDIGYHVQNGSFDHTPPSYPASFAEVDRSAVQSDVRGTPASGTSASDSMFPTIMISNNAFGNKYRFTDSLGNPSDAAVGSNKFAHTDFRGHSFTGALDGYVIDHKWGWGFLVKPMQSSGGKYTTDTIDGITWQQWMAEINSSSLFGFSDWLPLDIDLSNLLPFMAASKKLEWANLMFTGFLTADRMYFLTGNTRIDSITEYYYIGDTTRSDILTGQQVKALSTAFAARAMVVMAVRKHY